MHKQSPTAPAETGNSDVNTCDPLRQQAAAAGAGISREFSGFIADIEDLIRETASFTGDDLERVKNRLGERVSEAKKSVESYGDAITEQVRSGSVRTNQYVHEQPWKVIGAVAAVSFLLGMLTTRRN